MPKPLFPRLTEELEAKMRRLHKLESQVEGLQEKRQTLRKIITELAIVRSHLGDLEWKFNQAIEEIGE